MSYQTLTNFQKRRLWSLACVISQSAIVFYDEDHEFDEEREEYLKAIENILNTPEPLPAPKEV